MVGTSTLGQFQAQAGRINNLQIQLDRLSNQLSTGKIAQKFSGLGNDVVRSQRARANLRELDIFQRNIQLGSTRLDFQNNALNNIKRQTEIALDAINLEVKQGQIDLSRVRDTAATAQGIVKDLLNERDAENFLFAGSDALTRPVNDTGTLETAVKGLVNDWQNEVLTTDELLEALRERDSGVNPDAVTDTQLGYAPSLNQAKGTSIRADTNIEVDTTVKANEKHFRDILVALEALKQLPQEADGAEIDFNKVPDSIQNDEVVVTGTSDLSPAALVPDIFGASGSPLNLQGSGPQELQITIDDPVNGPQVLNIDLDTLDGTAGRTPDGNGVAQLINDAITANPNLTSSNFDAQLNPNGRLEITSDFDFTIDGDATGPTNPAPAGTLAFLGLEQDSGNPEVSSFQTASGDTTTSIDEQNEFFTLLEELAKDLQKGLEGVSRSRLKIQDAKATVNRIGEDIEGEKVALQNLVAQVEDIDVNKTAVELQQIQFQLQASFQVTSSISRLSLTNFLNI